MREVKLAYENVKVVDCLDLTPEGSATWEAALKVCLDLTRECHVGGSSEGLSRPVSGGECRVGGSTEEIRRENLQIGDQDRCTAARRLHPGV